LILEKLFLGGQMPMQVVTQEAALEWALDSLLNDRLAILIGAGLSMSPPSSLPSAWTIASRAKAKYDALYGASRPALPDSVDDQAEFFFQGGQLATAYFRTFIDFNAFAGQPNAGHSAVADLLLVRALKIAVTTNVDILVETAGQMLFGQIGAGVDGHAVAAFPADCSPLLKLHGCRQIDPTNMVWARGQLSVQPVSGRIQTSTQSLNVRLLDRDLLIVGYWTDWDYLNGVLAATLGAVNPVRVIVIYPAESAVFEQKAPELYALGQRATTSFHHLRVSGADFLDALRLQFAKSFVRQILHSGSAAFQDAVGSPPDNAWKEPPDATNDTLWKMRRDLEGCAPGEPAQSRTPPNEPLLGATLLQLQAGGATADGPYWLLNNERIRVLRAANKVLHAVEAQYEREDAPAIAPDIVIAVGAESQALAPNVARARTAATIARGSAVQWMTRSEAVDNLGL
jgi:hypothetical protein